MSIIPLPIQAAASGNALVDGVLWNGWKWSLGEGPLTLKYYLADDTGRAWSAPEAAAYASALQAWAAVANLGFAQTMSRIDASLVENVSNGDQMLAMTGSASVVGFHELPPSAEARHTRTIDENHVADYAAGQTGGFYNQQALGQDAGWSSAQLGDGGYFHMVFAHELGHALGLKHPHNAQPGFPPFPGVADGGASQLGTNGQNHQFWTIMSYNAQYRFTDTGQIVLFAGNPITGLTDYGYVTGPMAYDIAAIQYLYGANPNTGAGDTIYELPAGNFPGVGWTCIWDTGGVDTLRYTGDRDATLDLTAATLDGSRTGGGILSYAADVHGGFTIANGVTLENAVGGSGNDVIIGNYADNVLIGGLGADVLKGEDGNDVLYIDSFDTRIEGGSGFDYVIVQGSLGVTYVPSDSNGIEVVVGGSGADKINANAMLNSVYLHGGAGNDSLKLGLGGGYLWGDAGNDTLAGARGDDVLIGGAGTDRLDGGDGNDVLYFDSSDASVIGSAGFDYAIVDGLQAVSLTLSDLSGIEVAIGGEGDDRINASGLLYGRFNAYGGGGHDLLLGSSQGGYLFGDGGNDTLIGGSGADCLDGGDGNDYLYFDGADPVLIGGLGVDMAVVAVTAAVNVVVSDSAALETIVGNAGNDIVDASAVSSAISLYGGGGNDILAAGSGGGLLVGEFGDDALIGGNGNDVLIGGAGADKLVGGAGDDRLYINAADTEVIGDGGFDYAIFDGAVGFSFSVFDIQGLEAVVGGSGDDTLDAAQTAHVINLFGGAGDDVLSLGTGGGMMYGQDGNDTLVGSIGHNQYFGGDGADLFSIAASSNGNYIQDFSHAEGDKIRLHGGVADITSINIELSPGSGWYIVSANSTLIWVHSSGQLSGSDFIL